MYYCIVNPSARSGKGKDIWELLEKKFAEKGLEYRAVFTKGPGHATKLAHNLTAPRNSDNDKVGPTKLIVLGGDGTLNEAINGIQDFENTLVGYIPIGSSNDFARDLSFPNKTDDLIEQILEAKDRTAGGITAPEKGLVLKEYEFIENPVIKIVR